MPACYLYLIMEDGCNETGPTKIGIAVNVFNRLNQLQTGNPRKLVRMAELWFAKRDDALAMEQTILCELAEWRMQGEWLDLPPWRVLWEMAKKLEAMGEDAPGEVLGLLSGRARA